MSSPTTKLGPFVPGIDNRVRDYALKDPKSGLTAVRDAVNVDVSTTGHFTRRVGSVQVLTGTRIHSLWSNGHDAFFIEDGSLMRFTAPATAVTLMTGLSPVARGTYADIPGRGTAFSNGQVIKRITLTGVRPIGLGQPQAAPVLTAGVGGALPAGWYEVAISHIDAFGEESGVVTQQYIEVADQGRISVQLPRPLDAEAISTRIYVSARNSGNDYLAATVPVATLSTDIAVLGVNGKRLLQDFLLPLPAGDILAYYHGRTYSHLNGVVSFTEPWSGQYSPFAGHFAFPAPVTIMAAVAGGLYFVADQTYFLPGDATLDGNLRVVANTTGVYGTLVRDPDEDALYWFTPTGIARATTGGIVTYLQEPHVEVSRANRGAALFRKQDGIHQVITSLRDPTATGAGARSWFTVKMGSRETRNDF